MFSNKSPRVAFVYLPKCMYKNVHIHVFFSFIFPSLWVKKSCLQAACSKCLCLGKSLALHHSFLASVNSNSLLYRSSKIPYLLFFKGSTPASLHFTTLLALLMLQCGAGIGFLWDVNYP